MERLLSLLGTRVSPKINYKTLQPKDAELAKIITRKQVQSLNHMALPALALSIMSLILALFFILFKTEFMVYACMR